MPDKGRKYQIVCKQLFASAFEFSENDLNMSQLEKWDYLSNMCDFLIEMGFINKRKMFIEAGIEHYLNR